MTSPSALAVASHQVLWTYICSVCLGILWPDLLPPSCLFLAPDFSSCPSGLGFLKASLAGKDRGKEGIQFLSLCLLEQWAYIFPSLCFAICVLIKALLLAFDIPGRIPLLLGFCFPNLSLGAWPLSLYSIQHTRPLRAPFFFAWVLPGAYGFWLQGILGFLLYFLLIRKLPLLLWVHLFSPFIYGFWIISCK